MRVFKAIIASVVALWMVAGQPVAAQEEYAPQKVVYHINQSGTDGNSNYKGALNNIRNHINAVGKDNIDLRVVMHGDGLGLLEEAKDDQGIQTSIVSLKDEGVQFVVCNNTLTGRNIDPEEDLFDVWPEDIVTSGVAELGKLQMEGFAYIKP